MMAFHRFSRTFLFAFAVILSLPGQASAQCQCLAGYEPSGRARPETHFRAGDFAASGVFSNERGALLVQPLVYDGRPMGLLTFPLGERDGSVYEHMRETFALALRGFRLAQAATP